MKWIAIVDDDVTNLNIAGQILSKNKMRVSVMKSGSALLKFMQENRPDLILLDIAMPVMDGFETLKKLREYEAEHDLHKTPVIFLTADQETATESRGFEVGVSDFIRKPFYPEILLKRISNAVEQQKQLNRFEEDATTDKLTGFLNKAAAAEKAEALCNEKRGALMMIDLDSFKLVNDLYGHEMGDKVLVAFASSIRAEMPNGIYGRLGGDEFLVFANELTRENDAAGFSEALNSSFLERARSLMGEDMEIPLGASLGIVFTPEHGTDYAELLKKADKALYSVKQNGKHGYAIYGRKMDEMAQVEGIRAMSMLLNERNIPDCALRLDRESFMYVYRFLMRYIIRYQSVVCKVLFTVAADDTVTEQFGEHLKNALRKSDLMMKAGKNQFFVLLPEIKEEFASATAERVVSTWKASGADAAVTYETEIAQS